MDEVEDLPYRAEYAKSNRSSCRHCKGKIEKGILRLAALVQSPSFDGKITQWYHSMCFFAKQRPKGVEDIANFDSLRWEDQQSIKQKLGNASSATPSGARKGKSAKKVDKNFLVEYAKSSRGVCKGCENIIIKAEVRIAKQDYESETAKRYGPVPRWHHVNCFIGLRKELEFFDSAADLPGFNTLSADDKTKLREKIKAIERTKEDVVDSAPKRQKTEDSDLLKKQNDQLFHYRDLLEKNLKKAEMNELLEYNDYNSLSGETKILDMLADLMTFGVIGKCETCKEGNLLFKSGVGYVCNGNLSEWTKCTSIVEAPKRKAFQVPEEFKENFSFLKKYKFKKAGNRVVVKRASNPTLKRKIEETSNPLDDFSFVILGSKFERSKAEIVKKIKSFGGVISKIIEPTTAAVITTRDYLAKEKKKFSLAEEYGIECVSEDFLDEVEKEDSIMLMIKKKNFATWAKDVEQRLSKVKKLKSSYKSSKAAGSKYEVKLPETVKITLKDGAHVDQKSGLAGTAHVYKQSGKLYSVVLGLVDLARGINSYYRLQVLESDDKRSWYVFRSWGRIGTTIGDNKVENKMDLQDALRDFNDLYEKKTGNKFTAKEQQKLPGFWYPLEIDHGQSNKALKKLSVKDSKSKLHLAIQELISLLFDVKSMESTMVQYELDLKKMPLGKLSQRQIENAYKVLSEAMEWIEKLNEDETKAKSTSKKKKESNIMLVNNHLLDCSNRFYTLIPHDFGMKNPPLLDNEDYIKTKIEMIDSLKEIEIAYNLLKSENEDTAAVDPIDKCYNKLKTKMEVLDKSSNEFDMIKTYVKNTHASTHAHYTLELDEVFKIDRHGEEKKFKPFKKLHNRQLLWHGSRLTNFVGILSQGLRIAPPEAPATGYMFGKGVYFADMVSKSANYCCTSVNNSTGILLLCDVALGDMYELKNAKYITKLPSGKHSTKGVGTTCPDPEATIKTEDGYTIPLGKGKESDVKSSSLLYNEYIVYDTAQINIKYLLKTSFKYKY